MTNQHAFPANDLIAAIDDSRLLTQYHRLYHTMQRANASLWLTACHHPVRKLNSTSALSPHRLRERP